MRILFRVRGVTVIEQNDGSVSFMGGMTVNGDGSPRCYAPVPLKGLDYLSNAGEPGNWYGIATDPDGNPYIQRDQDPFPGFYVSTTAYQDTRFLSRDPRRYLDSEKIPYIVVPRQLRNSVKGVVLGCAAIVTRYSGSKAVQSVLAVVGDIGPATHLGEASIAVAKKFGINADPKTGGVDEAIFEYRIRPGTPVPGFKLHPM